MHKDTFNFFLYRLNKEIRSDLFSGHDRPRKSDDEWLEEYLKTLCQHKYDYTKETRKSIYTWSLRNYTRVGADVSSFVLARSTLQKTSTIVTDDALTVGNSISTPPPADTIILLIYWSRHIVVVENRAGMTTGEMWLRNFHEIVDLARLEIPVPIAPRFEPIPVKGTILHHLNTLDRVFRFRVRLKLPNPELNRWAEKIYNEMVEERIQEYLQEFNSQEGIKVSEDSKAYSSAALAELGYKEGGVQIDGEKDGRQIQIDEGKTAIRGKIDQLRALIRGLETNASGKMLPQALDQIRQEIDRLFPHEG
jgi:hypothetical protein